MSKRTLLSVAMGLAVCMCWTVSSTYAETGTGGNAFSPQAQAQVVSLGDVEIAPTFQFGPEAPNGDLEADPRGPGT